MYERPENLNLSIGCSVAVNGVCSTVRTFDDTEWEVEYMPETLRLTSLGSLQEDDLINIEPTLRLGDELSGHMVQGHVDGIGQIQNILEQGQSWVITIKAPQNVMDYVVYKGSITVDGISLTISGVDEQKETFEISLIEHTLDNTNLRTKKVGDNLNLEADIVGKYIKKFTTNK